jgi:hypothetical protein
MKNSIYTFDEKKNITRMARRILGTFGPKASMFRAIRYTIKHWYTPPDYRKS